MKRFANVFLRCKSPNTELFNKRMDLEGVF